MSNQHLTSKLLNLNFKSDLNSDNKEIDVSQTNENSCTIIDLDLELEKVFKHLLFPSIEELEKLSKKYDTEYRTINVWFQRRRQVYNYSLLNEKTKVCCKPAKKISRKVNTINEKEETFLDSNKIDFEDKNKEFDETIIDINEKKIDEKQKKKPFFFTPKVVAIYYLFMTSLLVTLYLLTT